MSDRLMVIFIVGVWPIIGAGLGWGMALTGHWGAWLIILGGLIGLVMTLGLFPEMTNTLYRRSYPELMTVFGVYAVVLFGLTLGIPVLQPLLSLPVGWYINKRLSKESVDAQTKQVANRQVKIAIGMAEAGMSLASGVAILADPYTLGNIRGLTKLPITETELIVGWLMVTIILVWLSIFLVHKMLKINQTSHDLHR